MLKRKILIQLIRLDFLGGLRFDCGGVVANDDKTTIRRYKLMRGIVGKSGELDLRA